MTFQRILTYALNSVTKKIVQVFFLAVGLLIVKAPVFRRLKIV
jgi:hypothetical protein